MCQKCYGNFVVGAAKSLVQNEEGKVITFSEWAQEQLDTKLTQHKAILADIRQKYRNLQQAVEAGAFTALKTKLGGRRVDLPVFQKALEEVKTQLWREMGGNKLHFQLKTEEKNVKVLEGLIEGFKKPLLPAETVTSPVDQKETQY